MIVFRKGGSLRLLRHTSPDPPFWAAGTVLPYSSRRATPVAIDWLNLSATAAEYEEVQVAQNVPDAISRAGYVHEPLLIEATGPGELTYRRGAEAAHACAEAGIQATLLVTADAGVPDEKLDGVVVALAAWPPSVSDLDRLARQAAGASDAWGITIPVVPPVTTDLDLLERIADVAAKRGARFLSAVPIDVEPAARRRLAEGSAQDEETWSMLFDSDLELFTVANERHIAALAAERGLADLLPVAATTSRSNWEGAAALASTGNRMIRMNHDVEAGWEILRASRTIAALGKPLQQIAASASLSIIEPLGEFVAAAVGEWLERGTSSLVERTNERWRLRRDYAPE